MRGMTLDQRLRVGLLLRGRKARRGQVLVLAVILIFLFFLAAVALIDVYHVEEARVWGYRVAQQAAIAGVAGDYSVSTPKWTFYQPTATVVVNTPTPGASGCIDPVKVELVESEARAAAETILNMEMERVRGFDFDNGDYIYEIQVLPNFNGGTTTNFPPEDVRLGISGDWSAQNPAVGVYLSFRVYTFISSIVGREYVWIHVFAAAEVSQPPVCPP
jgi:hypothetical protein